MRKKDDFIHVLIVEDNEGFAYFLRDVLRRQALQAFSVDHVTTLADALNALRAQKPDIILLDLGLPDSSGMATLSRIQNQVGQVPIIVLTVLDDDELAVKAVRMGAQDYLVKNEVSKDLLVRSIFYAIERGRVQADLRYLSGRLLRLQDEERRRIARELHDVTAQNLAALSMNLLVVKRLVNDAGGKVDAILDNSLESVDECSRELRTLSYVLHPPMLDELGLAGAVREFADGFASRSGLRVDLTLPDELDRLPRDVETALFRVLQESLTNVHRHSGSGSASITLGHGSGEVTLSVSDSGHGMPSDEAVRQENSRRLEGVGIPGMRERVQQLGGRLEIQSGGRGTCVRAVLPVRANGDE